ncbi:hypothetical protein [Nonomuraea polychroma]|uniref:hypothetical protein n=1 Tax=Nonomuraea polychroma TaxID=46176 RepID=UPI000FDE0FC8|nr:hypothetical protein [Nonomuraea polychroma]
MGPAETGSATKGSPVTSANATTAWEASRRPAGSATHRSSVLTTVQEQPPSPGHGQPGDGHVDLPVAQAHGGVAPRHRMTRATTSWPRGRLWRSSGRAGKRTRCGPPSSRRPHRDDHDGVAEVVPV